MDTEKILKMLTKNGHGSLQTIRLLDQLHQRPCKAAEIADRNNVSTNTVYRSLDPFVELGLVDKNGEKYVLNGAGAVIAKSFNSATEDLSRDDISFIIRSRNRYYLLTELWNQPNRKMNLDDFGNESPSRATIKRIMQDFESRDWVVETTHQTYSLTIKGEQIMRTLNKLSQSIDQTIDKLPCLRNLGVECQELPAHALKGEKTVISDPSRPFYSRQEHIRFVNQIDPTDVEYVRGFAKYHDQEESNMIIPMVEQGAKFDCVSDKDAFHQAISELDNSSARKPWKFLTNFRWRVSVTALPMGMLIFDEKWVVFGPGDLENVTPVSGVIFAANDQVIQWAIKLFEQTFERSEDPPGYAVRKLRERVMDLSP